GEGLFAYAMKNQIKEKGGKYWVSSRDAILRKTIVLDEIDMDNGIILLPECVTAEEAGQPPSISPPGGLQPPAGGPSVGVAEAPISPPPRPGQPVESVIIEMILTKALLYKTFNILGLLADKAGDKKIKVRVEGTNLAGVDPTWIRNAIIEPLSEANIPFEIKEETKKSS
ncbi:MAG: hypothetical protein N3B16_08925, partial [Candidatus Aminicenantes bacterium]|nr:hypothetical protein [Candidatus Aminicenantes bacterium]